MLQIEDDMVRQGISDVKLKMLVLQAVVNRANTRFARTFPISRKGEYKIRPYEFSFKGANMRLTLTSDV